MRETVNQLGEFGLIHRIREWLGSRQKVPKGTVGIGDDAAVLIPPEGYDLLITTDSMIEERHFLREAFLPKEVGRRAMVQNISDVGAMGGIPYSATISLCLPEGFFIEDVIGLYEGFLEELLPFEAPIVGGNITAGATLEIHITMLGIVERGKAIRRSGAKDGDAILVTGFPGQAALGLTLLKNGYFQYKGLIDAYLRPKHRAIEARKLFEADILHAMIDISDGLLGDLRHICEESKVGAMVMVDRLPRTEEMLKASRELRVDLYKTILGPSDDYEILFTLDKKDVDVAKNILREEGLNVSTIGEITAREGIVLRSDKKELYWEMKGWDHFNTRAMLIKTTSVQASKKEKSSLP